MHITVRRFPAAPFVLAASVLAAVLMLVTPLPASAHDSLQSSSPAADSTVPTLPAELTLTFSAGLVDGKGATEVVVTDAAGNSVTDGPATVDGATVTQPLVSEADAGVYRVIWKVVSSDGHPTSEEFSFTVATSTLAEPTAATTADPAPSETPSAVQSPPATATPEGTPADGDAFLRVLPWIIGAVIVAGLGGAIVATMVRRARRRGTASDSDDASAR
ncbi:copper resistance CopC family protein [Microbacterium aurantiacum]|uniref:copper resistance CopC family protein n=1 Tax=Microbacterium aurantiacum TaxID=162393 RepID=UPI001FE6B370|nr:copper resistance protein CopC [Microbacterium aurantiacum]